MIIINCKREKKPLTKRPKGCCVGEKKGDDQRTGRSGEENAGLRQQKNHSNPTQDQKKRHWAQGPTECSLIIYARFLVNFHYKVIPPIRQILWTPYRPLQYRTDLIAPAICSLIKLGIAPSKKSCGVAIPDRTSSSRVCRIH